MYGVGCRVYGVGRKVYGVWCTFEKGKTDVKRAEQISYNVKQIIVMIRSIRFEEQRERAREKEIRPSTHTRLYWGYVIKGGGGGNRENFAGGGANCRV